MSFLKRHRKNPILTPRGRGWESAMVYNAAAIYEEGKIHIFYRAQRNKRAISYVGYASTKDGFYINERLSKPVFGPARDNELEKWGVEDPRIVKIGRTYYMTYTAYGQIPRMSNVIRKVEYKSAQIGITTISAGNIREQKWEWGKRYYPFGRIQNKDGIIFPEKINGKYVMYHRISPYLWSAESRNLHDWTNHKIVMGPEFKWEYYKIGSGPSPIKTKNGWIIIYHGVDRKWRYFLGLAVADLENPSKIIYRHKEPILSPEKPYEKEGFVPYVVFSNGAVEINGEIFVYYGAADTVLSVATTTVKDILKLF
ncbi:MAG: glycosidase [Candidatus Auribacterota bacterium]|nr:glycosidase [Candidatus Auribacterota bacterium]